MWSLGSHVRGAIERHPSLTRIRRRAKFPLLTASPLMGGGPAGQRASGPAGSEPRDGRPLSADPGVERQCVVRGAGDGELFAVVWKLVCKLLVSLPPSFSFLLLSLPLSFSSYPPSFPSFLPLPCSSTLPSPFPSNPSSPPPSLAFISDPHQTRPNR